MQEYRMAGMWSFFFSRILFFQLWLEFLELLASIVHRLVYLSIIFCGVCEMKLVFKFSYVPSELLFGCLQCILHPHATQYQRPLLVWCRSEALEFVCKQTLCTVHISYHQIGRAHV